MSGCFYRPSGRACDVTGAPEPRSLRSEPAPLSMDGAATRPLHRLRFLENTGEHRGTWVQWRAPGPSTGPQLTSLGGDVCFWRTMPFVPSSDALCS